MSAFWRGSLPAAAAFMATGAPATAVGVEEEALEALVGVVVAMGGSRDGAAADTVLAGKTMGVVDTLARGMRVTAAVVTGDCSTGWMPGTVVGAAVTS